LQEYIINFTYNLDPNELGRLSWPKYNSKGRAMLDFRDHWKVIVGVDNDRDEEMKFIQELSLKYTPV